MNTNVKKWGNSLGIRIPNTIAQKLNLHDGSKIELKFTNDHLSIYPVSDLLSELLSKVTDDNKHNEVFDDIEGNENWKW